MSGNVPASKPSYGYTYRAEYQGLEHGKRKLIRAWWEINVLDTDGTPKWGAEARVVVHTFHWIGHEGRSTFWVAEELNRLGIKPRYAEKWSPALIGFICKNNAYTGKHAYNKACYVTNPERPLTDITAEIKRTLRKAKPEDDWAHFDVPALVSEELWRRARRERRAISPEEIEKLTERYLARLPYKVTSCRFHSFVVYFSNLQRLGWVEFTGREEPSEPSLFLRLHKYA